MEWFAGWKQCVHWAECNLYKRQISSLQAMARKHMETILHDGCSIGANATILCGVSIGSNSIVGAGSVVTKDVPPDAKVIGNPAKIIRP